jgi:uncharacterized protein YutE (UPF0331/DUF86 family)
VAAEVNLDRIRDLAGHLRDAVRQLRALAGPAAAEFAADTRTANAAKYLLIVACEAALDVCNHLASRRASRSPEDYADCMTVLAELDVLSLELAQRLARMARFRNLLVHLYARVDDTEVHRVIREDLGDLEAFLVAVGRYLRADIDRRP